MYQTEWFQCCVLQPRLSSLVIAFLITLFSDTIQFSISQVSSFNFLDGRTKFITCNIEPAMAIAWMTVKKGRPVIHAMGIFAVLVDVLLCPGQIMLDMSLSLLQIELNDRIASRSTPYGGQSNAVP